MPVDPQIQSLLDLLAGFRAPPMSQGTPRQARDAFRQLTVGGRDPATLAPVAAVEQATVPGPAGPLPVRVYRPGAEGPVPTVVFLHGGGFVIGDLDTHDDQARLLCRDVGAVVVSVDYRLAPEHPFPAGVQDCVAATRWVLQHPAAYGGDADRVAVAGDSAGGNLSAAVTLALRDDPGPGLAAQLLLYPAVDFRGGEHDRYADDLAGAVDYPSRAENATGRLLTVDDMTWFAGHYLPDPVLREDPAASVVLAGSLVGLPPAVVATAEFDPLRDEGEAYAAALARARVPVTLHRYPGMVHGFFGLGPVSLAAATAVTELCADLRELLAAA